MRPGRWRRTAHRSPDRSAGPRSCGGLVVALLAADDAVVGEVAALEVEVVDRVVRAVGVGRRQDEDVEVVDEAAGRRVDRVVAQQLLGRLQAGQRRRPLAGVLLAVEEDADPGAVAPLSDPHDGVAERSTRHVAVGRRSEEVGQVDLGPGGDGAAPGVAAVGLGDEPGVRRRAGVDRGHDLSRRAHRRAARVGGEPDEQVVAGHRDGQRRVRDAGVDELGGDAVAALMPPRARGEDDGVRRRLLARRGVREAVAGVRRAGHEGLCAALVAVGRVRQRDQLRDVRELRRQIAEAPVDLGRVHVAGREVLQEARAHRRQAAAEPGVDRRLDRRARARADADPGRSRRRRGSRVADPEQLAMLDVRVGRRVRVDVEFITRGRESIGVPAPRFQDSERVGPSRSRCRVSSGRRGPWPRRTGSGRRSSRSSRRAGRRSRPRAPAA